MGLSKQILTLLTLLLCCVRLCSKPNIQLTYMYDGRRCTKCAPGTYFLDHCAKDDESAHCKRCPDGTFNSHYSIAIDCFPCKRNCEHPDLVKVADCTPLSDTECACPKGKYNINSHLMDLYRAKCVAYDECGPGYGVKDQATSDQNTECERCHVGKTYSASTSASDRCEPCTNCGQFNVKVECNSTHNRICDVPLDHGGYMISNADKDTCITEHVVIAVLGVLLLGGVLICPLIYFFRRQLPFLQTPNIHKSYSPVCIRSESYQMSQNNLVRHFDFTNSLDVTSLERQHSQSSTTSLPPSTASFDQSDEWHGKRDDIMRKLSYSLISVQNWEDFIRCLYQESGLNVDEADTSIMEMKNNYQNNVREQIYQCCQTWERKKYLGHRQKFLSMFWSMENIIPSLIRFGWIFLTFSMLPKVSSENTCNDDKKNAISFWKSFISLL